MAVGTGKIALWELCVVGMCCSRYQHICGVVHTYHSRSFLAHFQEGDKDLICLDQAASDLGVERRRIYDVVNILEALEVVSRKEKNWYHWHGLECLPDTMQYLRNAAIYDGSVPMCDPAEILQGMGVLPNVQEAAVATESARSCLRSKGSYCRMPRAEDPSDKRERSMGALAQRFLQLFLVGRSAVTLEYAADCLMEGDGSAKMKTRVRRLYDIANVLCMLRVVAKDTIAGTRKPVFRWIGTDRVPDFTKIRPPTPPRRTSSDAEQRRASALTAAAAHGRDAATVRAQMAAQMGGVQLHQQQVLAAMAMQQQRHAAMLAAIQQQAAAAAAAAASGNAGAQGAGGVQQGTAPPGYTVMMVAGPNGPTPMLVSSAMLMQQMIHMQAARGMMQQQQQQRAIAAAAATAGATAGSTATPISTIATSQQPAPQKDTFAPGQSVGGGSHPSLPPRAPLMAPAVGPPESLLTDPGFGPGGVRNVILSAPHAGGWCILPGVVAAAGGGGSEDASFAFAPLQVATARTTGRGTGVDMGTSRVTEQAAENPLVPAKAVQIPHPAHSGRTRVAALRYHPAPAGRVATAVAVALTEIGAVPPPAGPFPCAVVNSGGARGGDAAGHAIDRTVQAAPLRSGGVGGNTAGSTASALPPQQSGGATITGNSSARPLALLLDGGAPTTMLGGGGHVLRDSASHTLGQDDDLIDDAATDAGSMGGVQGGWMAPDAVESSTRGGSAIYGWSVPVPDTPLPARRSSASLTGGSAMDMSPSASSVRGSEYNAGAPPTHCSSTVKKAAGSAQEGRAASSGAFLSPARATGHGVGNSAAEASPYVGGVEGMPMSRSHSLSEFLANRREAMNAVSLHHVHHAAGRMATVAGAGGAISSSEAALASRAGNGIRAGFTPQKSSEDAGDGMAEFLATAKQIQQDIDTARAAAESNGTALGGRTTGGASARRHGRKRKSIMMEGGSSATTGAPPRSAAGVSMLNFNMFSPAAGGAGSRLGGIATSGSVRRVAARTVRTSSPGTGQLACTPQRFLASNAATPGFAGIISSSPDKAAVAAGGGASLLGLDLGALTSPPRSTGRAGGVTTSGGGERPPQTMLFMSPFASTVAFRVEADEHTSDGGLLLSPTPPCDSGSKPSSAPSTAPRPAGRCDPNTTTASLTLSTSTGGSSSSGDRSLAASLPSAGEHPASACSLHSGAGDISHIPSTGSSRAQSGGRGGPMLSPIPSMNLSARLEQAASTAQRKQRRTDAGMFSPQEGRKLQLGGGASSLRRRALSQAGDTLDESVSSVNLQTEVS